MRSFETYVLKDEPIEIKGILPRFDYVVNEIQEGNYRMEIVNVEKGIIEKQLEFKVMSKESIANELIQKRTENLVEDLLNINRED